MNNSNFIKQNLSQKTGEFKIGECFGKRDFLSTILGAGFVMLLLATPAHALDPNALPTGMHATTGITNITTNQNTLDVNASTSKSIANWQTFNVGSNAQVNFNLPNSQSAILNRVTGGTTSEIYGSINSNGNVFLVNPSGLFFSRGSQINVNSLVASTLSISDKNFLNGNYIFENTGSPSFIINEGKITTNVGGSVALLSGSITNKGEILTPQGKTFLAVGDTISVQVENGITLDVQVDARLKQRVNDAQNAILNEGSISATDGLVKLQAELESAFYESTVNNTGLIQADGIINAGGEIVLASNTGLTKNSGSLSAQSSTGKGGNITVTGELVEIAEGAKVYADGNTGGGSIKIGGGYQGKDSEILNSTNTLVAKGTELTANAIQTGNGGEIIVWADKNTFFDGSAFARGGSQSGNGGLIETSGKEKLGIGLNAEVNTLAPNGKAGKWLLDPRNITIQTGGTDTPTLAELADYGDSTSDFIIDPSILEGAATNIILEAHDNINFNSDVNITTPGVGIEAYADDNINVNANITTTNGDIFLSGDTEVDFVGDVNINAGASVSSSSGNVLLYGYNTNLNPGSLVSSLGGAVGIAADNNIVLDNTSLVSFLAVGLLAPGNIIQTDGTIITSALGVASRGNVELTSFGNAIAGFLANSTQDTVSFGGSSYTFFTGPGDANITLNNSFDLTLDDPGIAPFNIGNGSLQITNLGNVSIDTALNAGSVDIVSLGSLEATENITTTGGAVAFLGIFGDLITENTLIETNGGDVQLSTLFGDVSVGAVDSGVSNPLGDSADAGDITIGSLVGDVKYSNLMANSFSDNGVAGFGGDISILTGGGDVTFVPSVVGTPQIGAVSQGSLGSKGGGDITIAASGNITTPNIINYSTTYLAAGGATGDAGNVSLVADGTVTVNGGIDSRATSNSTNGTTGNGGLITILAGQGGLNVTGLIDTGSYGNAAVGDGGGLLVSVQDDLVLNNTYNTQGSFYPSQNSAKGSIILESTDGNITTKNLNASSFSTDAGALDGGDILLNAPKGSITTGLLNSSTESLTGDSGNGGSITLNAGNEIITSGNILSGSVTNVGNSGDGGDISLLAVNNITNTSTSPVPQINSFSGAGLNSGDAGNVTIVSTNGAVNTVNVFAPSLALGNLAGEGGDILIQGNGVVSLLGVDARSVNSSAGNFTSSDGGDVTIVSETAGLNIDRFIENTSSSNGFVGDGGNVTLQAAGNINVNSTINNTPSKAESTDRGSVNIFTSVGDINIANDLRADSYSNDGQTLQAGDISIVTNNGSINTKSLDSSSIANGPVVNLPGDAGNIFVQANNGTLNTVGNVFARSETVFGFSSNGGDVTLSGTNGVTNSGGSIITHSLGSTSQDGGNVTILSSQGNIQTVPINTTSIAFGGAHAVGQGNAGDVTINAFGTVDVEKIDARAWNLGFDAVGIGDGGDVSITSQTAGLTIDQMIDSGSYSKDFVGEGGDITLTAQGNVNVNVIMNSTKIPLKTDPEHRTFDRGGVTITSNAGNVTTLDVLANSYTYDTGINGNILLDGSDINISAVNGSVTTGELNTSTESFLSESGNAGSVNIVALNDVQVTNGGIKTNSYSRNNGPSGEGGNINIQSIDDSIAINGYVNAGSLAQGGGNSGNGGNITLTAKDNITHTGAGIVFLDATSQSNLGSSANGGNVNLVAQTGNLNLQSVASGSFALLNSGDAGEINLSAGNDINALSLDSRTSSNTGTAGLGGDLNLTAANSVRALDLITYSSSNAGVTDGGDINVTAANTIQLNTINNPAFSGRANIAYGDITLTGDEVNLIGGPNTVFGVDRNIVVQQFTPDQFIQIGGTDSGNPNILDFTTGDVRTLSDGFTSITIGSTAGTGVASVVAPTTFLDPTTIQNGSVNTLADLAAPSLDINALTGDVQLAAVSVTAADSLTIDAPGSISALGGIPRLQANFIGLTASKVGDPSAPIGLKATDAASFVNDGAAQYIPGQNTTFLNDWINGGGNPFRQLSVTADGFYLYPLFVFPSAPLPLIGFDVDADNSLFFPNFKGERAPVVSLTRGSLTDGTSPSAGLFVSTAGTYVIPSGVEKTDTALASLFDKNGKFILATGKSTSEGKFVNTAGRIIQPLIGNLQSPNGELVIFSGTILPINNVGNSLATGVNNSSSASGSNALENSKKVSLSDYISQ